MTGCDSFAMLLSTLTCGLHVTLPVVLRGCAPDQRAHSGFKFDFAGKF